MQKCKRTKQVCTVRRHSVESYKSIEIRRTKTEIFSYLSLSILLSLTLNDVSLRPYSLAFSARIKYSHWNRIEGAFILVCCGHTLTTTTSTVALHICMYIAVWRRSTITYERHTIKRCIFRSVRGIRLRHQHTATKRLDSLFHCIECIAQNEYVKLAVDVACDAIYIYIYVYISDICILCVLST